MRNELEAILVGGTHNEQRVKLNEAASEITIVSRVLERDGRFREVFRAKYELASNGPPLRYEFRDST